VSPRLKPKPKFGPNEVVVAVETRVGDLEGIPGGVLHGGARLRGSHPLVLARPDWFVADGTPEHEWPLTQPTEPDWDELRPVKQPPPIPPLKRVVCVRGCSTLSHAYVAGQIVNVDELAEGLRGYFSWFRPLDGPDADELREAEGASAA
jgi:hypothetical protein